MAVGDAHVFPGFLTPVLTQLFFPKPLTTFFTCFCRGERRKYAGKKSRLNRGSNSQPLGHESGRGCLMRDLKTTSPLLSYSLKFTFRVVNIEISGRFLKYARRAIRTFTRTAQANPKRHFTQMSECPFLRITSQ